jgi:membrane fusion protein (multidrug efflux system)
MFVRARIEEGVVDNAVLVPQVGVTHDPQGRATALVVGPDNKVALRTLQVQGTRGDQWLVQGGLGDGERVIVAGVQKVQPGAVVQPTEVPVATAAAPAASAPSGAVVSQAQ